MFPYVPPQVKTADEIENEIAAADKDFIQTKSELE